MKIIGTYTDIGYQYWASYIINGDASGLEDSDIAECDAWLAGHKHAPLGTGEEFEFTHDAPGVPGAGVEYLFPVYEGDYPDGPQFWEPSTHTPPIIPQPPDAAPWDSLPKRVQEKILDDHRYDDVADWDWWDTLFDGFTAVAETLCVGIEENSRRMKAVYFESYPWGCSFDGLYGTSEYRQSPQEQFSLARLLIRAKCPQDKELHRIADGLYEVQARNDFAIVAQVKSGTQASHSYAATIDVQLDGDVLDDQELSDSDEREVTQLLRDFMDWMASQLEAESDYLTSDEYVIERVREGVIDLSEYVVEAPQARYHSEYQPRGRRR
jgi:hypothetical protein